MPLDFMSQGKTLFVKYMYWKEDILFKVLYDKIYRPQVFSYVTESSSYNVPHPLTGSTT